MQVDFYQLGGTSVDGIIASLAGKLLADDQRLLVVAGEEAALTIAQVLALATCELSEPDR